MRVQCAELKIKSNSLKVAEGWVSLDTELLLQAIELSWVHVHPRQHLRQDSRLRSERTISTHDKKLCEMKMNGCTIVEAQGLSTESNMKVWHAAKWDMVKIKLFDDIISPDLKRFFHAKTNLESIWL